MSNVLDTELATLKERFQLVNFVETGTHLGDAVQAALDCGFERAYSCDLLPNVVAAARRRFVGDERVELHCADSLTFLRTIVKQMNGPAFFWLDAHFPELYGWNADPAHRFPLADELAIIGAHRPNAGDVVACDDIRVVADHANPTYVDGALERERHAALVIRNTSIGQLTAPLVRTHALRFIVDAQGILLLEPRVPARAAVAAY